jgi:hypothetical protein
MRQLVLLSVLLIGCPSNDEKKGPRCGADERLPPMAVDVGTLLIVGSPDTCPRAEPQTGSKCQIVPPSECDYRRPEIGVCAFDACACLKNAAGEVLWQCVNASP